MSTPFEEGNPGAPICFLAEAPSYVEVAQGKPLVGPSGLLFDRLMHKAGLIRANSYILNVFEERVVRDQKSGKLSGLDGTVLWTSGKGFTAAGHVLARPTLARLATCKANVIVPLGGVPLSLLHGPDRAAITKWRGSILSTDFGHGPRKFVPTIHPAAVLRGGHLFSHLIRWDLERAAQESKQPLAILPARSFIIDPTFQEVMAELLRLKTAKRIATDVEGLNHQISCLSFSDHPSRAISIPFVVDAGQDRWSLEEETLIWQAIADLLEDPSIEKINQNLAFDMMMYGLRNRIYVRGKLGDPMVAWSLMYPDLDKDLATICSVCTREPYYKDDGKIWQKPWRDLKLFWEYNAKDSCVALESFEYLEAEMDAGGYRATHDFTCSMFPSLVFMMLRGLKVDHEQLGIVRGETRRMIDVKMGELEALAGFRLNPKSTKQVANYFYRGKGLPAYRSTKTGGETTDDKALARLYRRYNLPEAKLIQEIRALDKLCSNYLEAVADTDSRMRCSYNPRGASTGRLSSSQTIFGTGLNFQNLPPEMRAFIVPG